MEPWTDARRAEEAELAAAYGEDAYHALKESLQAAIPSLPPKDGAWERGEMSGIQKLDAELFAMGACLREAFDGGVPLEGEAMKWAWEIINHFTRFPGHATMQLFRSARKANAGLAAAFNLAGVALPWEAGYVAGLGREAEAGASSLG